jgi:putative ABC transport system permease protein
VTPSNIVRFYALRLRARFVQELFAVLGIAIGVALLFASQVANTSLSGSVEQLTSGIVGKARLQLAARDPHGFDERLLGEVRRLPGVRSAAPVLDVSANVIGPTARRPADFIGVDARFVHLGGVLLRHFTASKLASQHAFGLPAPLAREIGAVPLQQVTFEQGATSRQVLVGIVLQESDIGALVHSPIVVAPLAYAQSLTGMSHMLTRILVQPFPGRDREVQSELQRLAGDTLNVRPANLDARIFHQAEGPTSQSIELFSAISALVGFLFAFNAMLLTAPQRRNLIADLRLDGYTPREVVEILMFDALILGIVGSLVGLLLGNMLSHDLLQADPGYLALAFPVGSQRIVTWECVALSAGGGMLAAFVGILNPLRDIVVRRPYPTTMPRSPLSFRSSWLLASGLACLATATATVLAGIGTVTVAIVAFVSVIVALLLLLPPILSAILAAFDRVQRSFAGVSPHLALIELRSHTTRVRSLAIAATGAIAVFGSVSLEGARDNLRGGLDASAHDIDSTTSIWVSPDSEFNTLATTPFKDRYSSAIARLPGVKGVTLYRGSFLDYRDRRVWVLAPARSTWQPIPPSQVLQGPLGLASERVQAHGWIAVSQKLASENHVGVGQTLTLPTPQPTSFRVAAITTNFGWPPGIVVLNAEDYARAWGSTDPSAYQVSLRPGASTSAVQHEIQHTLGPRSPLSVETAMQREDRHRASTREALSRLTQIRTLMLLAGVLAMAAAMGTMIWQRRRRLASMKVDGFGEGELWRSLLYESALLLGAGCSIGATFGLYGQLLLSHALASVTGFPVVLSVGGLVAVGSLALVAMVAVVIVAIPGYFATRVRPALQE